MSMDHIKRNAVKVDEFLFKAYSALEKNNSEKALSLYCAILQHYNGRYSAILLELRAAKKNKLIPDEFKIPKSKEDFLKIYDR